jgi:5-methyltetrahydrofolate--homocysteine methyltransferase
MADDFVQVLVNLEEQQALKMVQERLDAAEDPLNILEDSRIAMSEIGERFSNGQYFIPELVFAGEIMQEISDLVKPVLTEEPEVDRPGKVVVGTVSGDIHDIGKNIVVFMLESHGFEVVDLGVDVPISRFVETIQAEKPQVVGLSGFLTFAYDVMKDTVAAIEEAGLRDRVKIMIGGGQMDDHVKDYVKADAYGPDAMAAVNLSKGWVGVA